QAEDGIRDRNVTGVQTCALPIWWVLADRQLSPGPLPTGGPRRRHRVGRVSLMLLQGWAVRIGHFPPPGVCRTCNFLRASDEGNRRKSFCEQLVWCANLRKYVKTLVAARKSVPPPAWCMRLRGAGPFTRRRRPRC